MKSIVGDEKKSNRKPRKRHQNWSDAFLLPVSVTWEERTHLQHSRSFKGLFSEGREQKADRAAGAVMEGEVEDRKLVGRPGRRQMRRSRVEGRLGSQGRDEGKWSGTRAGRNSRAGGQKVLVRDRIVWKQNVRQSTGESCGNT